MKSKLPIQLCKKSESRISTVFLLAIGFTVLAFVSSYSQLSISAVVAISAMVVMLFVLTLLSILKSSSSKGENALVYFERTSDDPVFFEYWIK